MLIKIFKTKNANGNFLYKLKMMTENVTKIKSTIFFFLETKK